MSRLRAHLTYANVMATVAVFIALGGSSYAAITLTKNSVKSKHIAKGAVKRSDIGKRAVNSAKVADFSLLAKDFKSGQLPTGPQGGDKGEKGDTGAPGISGYEVVQESTALNSNPSKSNSLSCPGGKSIIGGGSNISGAITGIAINQDGPDSGLTVWESRAEEIHAQAGIWVLTSTAYCANVAP